MLGVLWSFSFSTRSSSARNCSAWSKLSVGSLFLPSRIASPPPSTSQMQSPRLTCLTVAETILPTWGR